MKLVATALPGVLRVDPVVHRDPRGFFLEVFHAGKFEAQGLPVAFVQDNHSASRRGTLRGLHTQTREPQGKLVRCIAGEIFDVAVESVQTSCGWGVPLMTLERARPSLLKHHAQADPAEWAGKHRTRRVSIDGLAARPTDRYIAGDPGTVPE